MSKWIWIGGGTGVAALIAALIWWRSSKSGADDNMLKLKLAADTKRFYDAGFLAGSTAGTADAGKPHNPIVVLDTEKLMESSMPGATADYLSAREQDFENGFNDGYEKTWVAPAPVTVSTMSVPASPKPGGIKEGQSAYDYGFSRGKSRGYSDGYAAETHDVSYYLDSDGSKTRQNESGDPVKYRQGYTDGYAAGVAAGATAKAIAEVSPVSSDTSTSGAPSEPFLSVAGILSVGRDARPSDAVSIGYAPGEGGTMLSIAGRRVLGVREAFTPVVGQGLAVGPKHGLAVGPKHDVVRTRLGQPVPMGMSPHPLWPVTS